MSAQGANRWLRSANRSAIEYAARFESLAAAGQDVHGEANFVAGLGPRSVLDGGCGTGRVAIELARRGIDVVGLDLDPDMLAVAQRQAPALEWQLADISQVDLKRRFDAIVLAGNVMLFLAPDTEAQVVRNLARHLNPDGVLVAGFQLTGKQLSAAAYDELGAGAGLELVERWSTWDRAAWRSDDDYAVSVHRLAS